MMRGTIVTPTIRYRGFIFMEIYSDIRLPAEVQKRRVAAVLENELTARQREIVTRVMAGEKQVDIAASLGVSRATVCRTYKRGIKRLQRFLRY